MEQATLDEDKFLTPEDLANRYGVKVRTVYRWNARGTGPKRFQAGEQKIRYRLSDVIAWEDARAFGRIS